MKIAKYLSDLKAKLTGVAFVSARIDLLQNQSDSHIQKIDQIEKNLSEVFESQEKIQRKIESKIDGELIGGDEALATPAFVDSSISNLNYIQRMPGEKIRIAFLILSPELWPSIEPVWKLASKDDRFITSVVVLGSGNPDISLPSQCKARSMLESKGIPYFTEKTYSLKSSLPHVIFYPLPYGSLYPEAYKPEVVAAMGCRIAYVSYGLEVGGGVFNARYQYDCEVQRLAWRVFVRCQTQLTSFARYCSVGNGHAVVTGHPRYELRGAEATLTYQAALSKARGRKIILWSPHFTVESRRKWSSFLDFHEMILAIVDRFPDLFLLIRPHPLLRSTLARSADWDPNRVEEWFKKVSLRENVLVDANDDYWPAFEVSTAILADSGSFLVEYLLTEKPICHLVGKDDIGLTEEARNLSCFYPGSSESEISSFLSQVINLDDPLLENRKNALQSYFGPAIQTPSKSILDHITNSIDTLSFVRRENSLISERHEKAFQYWRNATSTFLAPADYYERQEKELRNVLIRHGGGRFAADICCGNGRFTQIFSDYFEFVDGTDPSEHLIVEARENMIKNNISNIVYTVERLEHAESLSTYDFVSCMGVTSGLIDDDVFIKSIWKLKAAMRPGAKLLMKDSLSISSSQYIDWNEYTAVYRNIEQYLGVFELTGLRLLETVVLVENDESNRTNRFFLFDIKESVNN